MRVKLLKQHVINNTLFEPETVLGDGGVAIPPGYAFTPFMEGLDAEGRRAVYIAKVRAFGRVTPHGLLDDPPIERPLEENQPVPHVPAPRRGR